MARYEITAPNGQRFEITAPDGASQEQVLAYAKQQFAKKPAEQLPGAADVPWHENAAAGMGKAVVDAGRGLRQLYAGAADAIAPRDQTLSGLVTGKDGSRSAEIQAEIDEAKRRDAPLMDTGAGLGGNIVGNILTALMPGAGVGAAGLAMHRLNLLKQYAPMLMNAGRSMAIPTSIPGAAAVGGAIGAAGPVASDDSRLENTLISAGGGAGGVAAGRVLDAGARGAAALVAPFTEGGREKILGRTMNRFAGDADSAIGAMRQPQELVPGSLPTVAEASGDAGLSGLQLAAANNDPKIKAALARRGEQNNAARLSSLRTVAKDDKALADAIAARNAEAKPLYEAAKGVMVKADDELSGLLSRPSMQSAWDRATKLARENGETLTVGIDAPATKATTGILDASGNAITKDVEAQSKQYSGRGLHYLKMALDDMSDGGVTSGIGKNEQRALQGTRDKLVSWMDAKIPEYGQARATYAAKSQPVNEMQFGQEVLKRIQPALMDVAGVEAPTRMRAEMFASALRDSDQTIRRTLGRDIPIDNVLGPEANGRMQGVAKDLARKALADDRAKTAGSTTAQNLAGQNLLRQVIGPLGLPESWAESTAALSAARPLNWAYKIPETKLQEDLARLLLDPSDAAAVMSRVRAGGNAAQLGSREELARLLSGAPGAPFAAGLQSRE